MGQWSRRTRTNLERTNELMQIRLTTTEDFDCVVETIRERFLESDEISGHGRSSRRLESGVPTMSPEIAAIYGSHFDGTT